MPRADNMASSTRRYLREARDWLPAGHPLAIALARTADQLDRAYQAAVMSQYTKIMEQIERRRPPENQPGLPAADGRGLIGPNPAVKL